MFEYAPAPESRSIVDIKPSYGLFIDGEFVDGHGDAFKTISPATEEVLAEVAEADEADVDAAVKAARRAYTRVWSQDAGPRARQVPLPDRPHHPGARPRARRAGVARQRQADQGVPRRRRPDWSPRTSSTTPAGPTSSSTPASARPTPLGVAGQVIPWNFPLLMLAWKIAPALACGNTVVLKPAETTPLTALLFAEICQQADLPPGVVNIVTGAGETGQALVAHPDVDKVAFTGSTEVGRAIAKRRRRHRQEGHPRARRQGRQHRLRRRPDRPGRRGHRQRHLLQPGPRLLRRLAAAGAGVGRRRGAGQRSSAGWRTLRVGDPLDKNTDIGAINSAEQLARIRELSDIGEAEGAGRWSPPCELPEQRLLVPADDLHRRHPGPPDRPRGDLRPGAVGADLPHARRGGREGQQHAVRPVRRRLDRQGLADPLDGRPAARRRGLGQHVQQVRPDAARSAATRSRATAARAAGTAWRPTSREATLMSRASTSARPTSSTSAARSRARSRATPTSSTTQGEVPGQRRAGLPQGRPRRRRRRPQGVRRLVRPDGVQPRRRSSTGSPR